MVILMVGQILIVTGFTVIMLHEKYLPIIIYCMKPLIITKQCMKKSTCDCMTRHGTQPVCKVSDFYYLQFLRYRVLS